MQKKTIVTIIKDTLNVLLHYLVKYNCLNIAPAEAQQRRTKHAWSQVAHAGVTGITFDGDLV